MRSILAIPSTDGLGVARERRHQLIEDKMNDKTLSALTALAQKLGTTAEYLWGVLLKQAPLSGALDLAVIAAWGAGCVWLVRLVRRKTTGDSPEWDDEMGRAFGWSGAVLVCAIVALVGGESITMALTAILNPEYWALKQILK